MKLESETMINDVWAQEKEDDRFSASFYNASPGRLDSLWLSTTSSTENIEGEENTKGIKEGSPVDVHKKTHLQAKSDWDKEQKKETKWKNWEVADEKDEASSTTKEDKP